MTLLLMLVRLVLDVVLGPRTRRLLTRLMVVAAVWKLATVFDVVAFLDSG